MLNKFPFYCLVSSTAIKAEFCKNNLDSTSQKYFVLNAKISRYFKTKNLFQILKSRKLSPIYFKLQNEINYSFDINTFGEIASDVAVPWTSLDQLPARSPLSASWLERLVACTKVHGLEHKVPGSNANNTLILHYLIKTLRATLRYFLFLSFLFNDHNLVEI